MRSRFRLEVATTMVVTSSVLFAGCTTIPESTPREREHILAMDADGSVVDLSKTQKAMVVGEPVQARDVEKDSVCSPGMPPGLCDVMRGLDQRYRRENRLDVLIMVHGGLNPHYKAIKRAHLQLEAIDPNDGRDDEPHPGQIYPLFVVWNSDGLDSYGDHLWRIRRGAVWGWQAKLTSPAYALFDTIAAVSDAPKAWAVQVIAPLRSTIFNWGAPCIHVEPPTEPPSLRDRVAPPAPECGSFWGRFSPNFWPTSVLKVATTPVADVMGAASWNVMLRRADLLIRNSIDADDAGSPPKGQERVGGVDGLMRAILFKLEEGEWEKSKVDVTLIGHSMGAFVVNNIVARYPQLPIKSIVHMASADSLRSVENAIEPYLRQHEQTQFYNLMLHPEHEDLEVSYGNTVPQGSLLTWIDNLYTNPPTRLDRTSGRWDNAGRWIDTVPADVVDQMCFRIFDYSGDVPISHGAFDDFQYWKREFWTGGRCGAAQ